MKIYEVSMYVFVILWICSTIAAMTLWNRWQDAQRKIGELKESVNPKPRDPLTRVAVMRDNGKLNFSIRSFVTPPDGSLELYADDRRVVAYFKAHMWDWLKADPVEEKKTENPPAET